MLFFNWSVDFSCSLFRLRFCLNINDGLFLGDDKVAADLAALESNKISHLVIAGDGITFHFCSKDNIFIEKLNFSYRSEASFCWCIQLSIRVRERSCRELTEFGTHKNTFIVLIYNFISIIYVLLYQLQGLPDVCRFIDAAKSKQGTVLVYSNTGSSNAP